MFSFFSHEELLQFRSSQNVISKTFGKVFKQPFTKMLLIHIFQPQETYNYLFLHNLSKMENSAHFELLKYGVLQLMNFLL